MFSFGANQSNTPHNAASSATPAHSAPTPAPAADRPPVPRLERDSDFAPNDANDYDGPMRVIFIGTTAYVVPMPKSLDQLAKK